jgi:NAD(P)-dependent dehydrogenase (short-subunit alcohol dehydrogenase family)
VDLGLKGDVAVVVGGANGIGLAVARAFAAEAASVAILDLDPRTASIAPEIAARTKAPVMGISCDITDFDAVKKAAAGAARELGRIDHVVHAAAVGSGKYGFPFLNLDPEDWERVLRVNILGAVHVAHAFAPGLIEAGSGTLTFMASVAGQMGSQTDPPYSASKAALINFAQCVAKDLAPHAIRVNSICPGMVKTSLNRSVWAAWNARQPPEKQRDYEDWAGDKVRQVVPLGRWQEPEDMAQMAVFLASDRARNVTGQTINVDGGYVMHW